MLEAGIVAVRSSRRLTRPPARTRTRTLSPPPLPFSPQLSVLVDIPHSFIPPSVPFRFSRFPFAFVSVPFSPLPDILPIHILQVTTRSLRRLLWLPILLPPSPRLLSPLPRSIDGHRHLLLDSGRRTNTEEVRPLSLRPSLSPAHSIHSISPRPAKRLPSLEALGLAQYAGLQRHVPLLTYKFSPSSNPRSSFL